MTAMTRAATQLDTTMPTERPDATPAAGAEPQPEALANRLASLVARVGDDARRDPQGYLGRTVVPEGGE
jgi:hypothetical protein